MLAMLWLFDTSQLSPYYLTRALVNSKDVLS